jgi:fructosamine-3-kinase
MPVAPVDISWQVLRQIVHDWAGASADLSEVQPLEGGSVSTTLALTTTGGDRAVLKITPHRVDRSYADEALQLNLLRDVGVPAPRVYRWEIGTLDQPFSYLLMEFVEGSDLPTVRERCAADDFDAVQAELAELVLKLHSNTSTHYMRLTHSEPRRFESWPQCYREIYDGIWHEVEKLSGPSALPTRCRKIVGKVHERLEALLAHGDRPRLVHWDIWGNNLLLRRDDGGRWRVAALLDPACKYAHCEAELAYMELFHTVTPYFLRAYQQAQRLPPEYHRVRKPIYQLYEMLNHLRIFGPEYIKPTLAAVERVTPLV